MFDVTPKAGDDGLIQLICETKAEERVPGVPAEGRAKPSPNCTWVDAGI
jgi:hypothetical protein